MLKKYTNETVSTLYYSRIITDRRHYYPVSSKLRFSFLFLFLFYYFLTHYNNNNNNTEMVYIYLLSVGKNIKIFISHLTKCIRS